MKKRRSPKLKADWKKLNNDMNIIRIYLADGYTAKQIADIYSVSQTLFNTWMSKKAFELRP
jgi:hypothetical protein